MTDPIKMRPPTLLPQAPGAPGWKEKPKGGVFTVAILAAGIGYALTDSEGGRRLTPYLDSVSIPTACKGIIGSEVSRRYKEKLTFSNAECAAMENAYLAKMVAMMQDCVPPKVRNEMTYGEWVSYGHWAYNTGTGSFCHSALGRNLAGGNHAGACRSMAAWTYVTYKGKKRNCRAPDMQKICRGIPIRRDLEVNSCLEALP